MTDKEMAGKNMTNKEVAGKDMTGKETESGSLYLTGQCGPALQTGEDKISACVRVQCCGKTEDSAKATKRLCVRGPRFSIKQEQIMSVYPAPGERCAKAAVLPHIAVSPCTLPFECRVEDAREEEKALKTPFLALLLFREEEMPPLIQGHVGDLFENTGECGVFYPGCSEEEADLSCTFMDVPGELFGRIAPGKDELSYLVHGRKTEPSLKARALSASPSDEVQSVVFCNRTVRRGSGEEPCRNHVCLVSLAGCGGIWEGCERFPFVRLAVLHHWEFFAVKDTGLEKLLENVHAKGMSLPVSEQAGGEAKALLQNGYALLEHVLRDGSKTASFYRSPFVPGISRRNVITGDSPDALYRYDPEAGMFDVSYACAWEIGKLAVLAREDIARKIMLSRGGCLQRMRREAVRRMLADAGAERDVGKQIFRFYESFYGTDRQD